MELKRIDESGGAFVVVSHDELLTISNALNEVCNGLEIPEFATRIGVMREEALQLLGKVCAVYDALGQRTR